LKAKQAELKELKRLQSAVENGVEVFYADATALMKNRGILSYQK